MTQPKSLKLISDLVKDNEDEPLSTPDGVWLVNLLNLKSALYAPIVMRSKTSSDNAEKVSRLFFFPIIRHNCAVYSVMRQKRYRFRSRN